MTQPPDQQAKLTAGSSDATQTSETSVSRLNPGDLVADRFEIVRLLGMGAMGEVYRARDRDLDVEVALKVLRPELYSSADAMARFRQELLTARRVSHPHVIRLHDMIRDGDRWLLSMEFVDGQSLEAKLREETRLSVDAAVDLAKQLASGLSAAHAAGVVHRDLKPANILLTNEGQATISDFGIARSLSHAGLTREGLIVGTPDYLSPEQAAGEPVDGRSDLYALGIILCEMLSGKLPFNATTAQEAIGQRLAKSPTPLTGRDDVPRWLVDVCHRLLRRNVRRRYQGADEVLADLEAAGRGKSTRRWLPAAAATVLAAGVGLVTWQWMSDSADPQPATTAELPSIAVLPASGAPDNAIAMAVAGTLSDRLANASQWRPISFVRVATVLDLLQFDATAAPDHLARIGTELGARELILPVWSGDGAVTLQSFGADDQFVSANPPGSDLVTLFGGSPAPPPDAGWQSATDFYRGLALLEQGNATEAVPVLTLATERAPGVSRHWWAMARALETLGRNDAAQDAALQAGGRADGDDRYARLAKIWQAMATGDYDGADAEMTRLQERFANDSLVTIVAAEYWGDAGDLRQAEALLRGLLAIAPEHARGWFLLAKFSILQGESQQALDEYLVRALTLHNRLRNEQGKADVINAQGVAYEQLGQLDAAVSAYTQAAAIRNQIGDLRGEATTLRNLAAIEAVRGNIDRADEHWEQARIRLEKLNDLAGMADLYNDAGVLAEERGAYNLALEHYRQALEIRRRLPNQRSLAESLGNVGYVSFELGEYPTARAYIQQALSLSETVGDQAGLVHAQQNLALLDLAEGNLDEVARRLDSVFLVAQSLQMSQELAVNQVIRAELLMRRGRYAAAIEAAAEAGVAFGGQDDTRGTAQSGLVTAEIHLAMGALPTAATLLEDLVDDLRSADQRRERLLLDAALLVERNQFDSALGLLASEPIEGEVDRLRADLLAARVREAQSAEQWQPLVGRAESLGHWSLMLEVSRHAMAAAIKRGETEQAKALFEKRWPLLAPMETAQQKPAYAALTDTLCPVAGRSCEQWQAQREDIWSAALEQVPAQFHEQFARRVNMP